MTRPERLCGSVLTLLAVVSLALAAWAAPMVPTTLRLPDQLRSLADLKQVEIVFRRPLPPQYAKAGLTERSIRDQWTRLLEGAGLEVTGGKNVPRLGFVAMVLTDDRVPDARAYVMFCTVDQPAHLERLDQTLIVPTYTDLIVGIEHENVLSTVLQEKVKKVVENLVGRAAMNSGVPRH